ncbi:hypothetical protein DUT90_09370 [Polaribacter sp. WD7]|uniref:hypothetical protein n=1 Tax=Polaribacter sp. WD7 TaxID=2269061 RepID=UPI000DF46EDD|nr:hypothetical protein [Polaribacter sp. WD7]RCS25979.1 hypothetical protein DUT90_09370 [Polaribacter sp. WD7]
MKKSFKILTLLGVMMLMSFTADKCFILKNNTFTYRNSKKDVLVIFKENKHVEYHNDKEHYIKSDIEWVTNCEYYLIIRECNLPNFPFKMGTKMHIVVDKVSGKKVYYTSSLGGRSWEGRMTKVKKK